MSLELDAKKFQLGGKRQYQERCSDASDDQLPCREQEDIEEIKREKDRRDSSKNKTNNLESVDSISSLDLSCDLYTRTIAKDESAILREF
jgi:hypothetical protein